MLSLAAGLIALLLAVSWIGYLALAVTAISDPSATALVAWLVSTPAMVAFGIGGFLCIDRFSSYG